MEGFGNISTKNINELIKKIEQRIALITKNIDKNIDILNNKLSYCVSELARLKDEFENLKRDTEIELERLENELEELDEFVNHLYNECIKVNFGSVSGEKVASGIAPLKNWEQSGEMNPIYAKYAELDESGRNIANYLNSGYAASAWIQDFIDSGYSSISATDISGENVTADNLSSNSATLTSVSSTNLSSESAYVTYLTALSASGESALYDNVSSTNVIATNLSSVDSTITSLSGSSATITNITGESATIKNLTGTSAEITNVSSNALTALTAEGESSKYVDISGTNVTADNLSSNSATLTSVSSKDISAVNEYITNLYASSAQGDSAKYVDISSTNVTATNLTSTDANITNLTSTNINSTNLTALTAEGNSAKYNEISSTNLTAFTASGNSAIFNGISAQEISGNLSGLAGSATKLSSPRDISITGDEIGWTVTFDGSQNTAASGQIKKVYWSALSGNAVGSGSTDTSGIMTPDQIQLEIDYKISQAVAGVYQLKGNADWSALSAYPPLSCKNGYVYNIGDIPPESAVDHNGNRIFKGDNIVWVSAYEDVNKWDKLANTMEMTGKLDTTAFTSWSGVRFNETSANCALSAYSATTAFEAQKLGTETSADIITRASAGSAAWDWVSAHGDESITAFTTAASTNVDLVITSASGTSAGSEYTLAASGYRTNINPSTYLSASGANEYTSSFGLTDTAETHISEGHEASSWLDSNAHNYISALNVGEQHNASVTTASATDGSGTKYTINVSGYKTIVNPDDTFLSANSADEYTSSFGLTDTAKEYISAGYSAWSAVSGLISGGTISADKIIGTTISASSFSADDATIDTISSTNITAVEISANNYSGVSITSNSANVSSLTSNYILTTNITASSALSGTNISSDNTYVSSLNVLSASGISANFTSATINEITGSSANLNYVSAITISSNEYIGNSATISSISSDSISSNNLTALTAQGNSANYSTANISELTSDSAFITNLTALSASGDSATFNGISAQEGTISSLYANEISANVFDVSAISSESAVISSFSAHNIDGDVAGFRDLTAAVVDVSEQLSTPNLYASSFIGDSATITAITSDYAEIDEISSTFITALTASGNSAIFSGISAQVISGNLSGLAGSATQLSTARIISASGDATLSDISFAGSADVTGNIQIHSVNWSALDAGGNIVGSASTETSGIMPPSAINDLINSKVDSGTSGKLDTTAFEDWSAARFDEEDGLSARYALSAGSATIASSAEYLGDQISADVITSATAGSAAYNWLTGNSNIQNIVSSIDTSALHNVALTAIRTTSDSGSNYTLKASGFKTTITTNDWVSGSTESDGYDLKYGLTNKTTDYLNEGHSAWSSVSSLINGDTISANIVKASDGFSGQNISGDNVSSTIDDLIGSAQSGQSAYNWIVTNSAKMGLSAYTTEQIINGIAW